MVRDEEHSHSQRESMIFLVVMLRASSDMKLVDELGGPEPYTLLTRLKGEGQVITRRGQRR